MRREGLNAFDSCLEAAGLGRLTSAGISVFQVNMGSLCNLSCGHCHVNAGPDGKEVMGPAVMDQCLRVIERERFPVVDVTGGAPEMNSGYRRFVSECVSFGCHVRTRTNLAVLLQDRFSGLPAFWASRNIEVIGSLPYYLEETADRQRGRGVFAASIKAIEALNMAGYGVSGSPLVLNLVYNPCGAYLPPGQRSIESDFREQLAKRYGVSFTSLFTITNMPVGRFLEFLERSGNLKRYQEKLRAAFNPAAAANVMCRNTVSVGWDGSLYDCDFNQALKLGCGVTHAHIKDYSPELLASRQIVTGVHCFGCTAGAGSSCTGAVA